MEVVFIRHGQTKANAAHRHQTNDEPLSVSGIAEAVRQAPFIAKWQPTHIITSPMARAQQTAQIIADKAQLPAQTMDEFRELRRPLYIFGRHHYGLSSWWYMFRWFFQAWVQFDDARNGESYLTFRKRLERARSLLEQYPTDAKVVVVSHSIFINFFVEHVCATKQISLWRAAPRLFKILTLKNTNATHLALHKIDETEGVCAWEIKAYDVAVEDLA